jgi:hypothetical protein
MDLKSYSRWYDYSRARDDMLSATHTEWAPWFAARSDDKKRVRLNIIKHILSSIPYEVPKAAEDRPAQAGQARRLPGTRQPARQVRAGSLLSRSAVTF